MLRPASRERFAGGLPHLGCVDEPEPDGERIAILRVEFSAVRLGKISVETGGLIQYLRSRQRPSNRRPFGRNPGRVAAARQVHGRLRRRLAGSRQERRKRSCSVGPRYGT
jgi:hypothetical protein